VLLPPAFAVGKQIDGRWRQVDEGIAASPQAARGNLVGYLRVTIPWQLNLDDADRAVYAAAAQRLEDQQADDLEVAGRRFRIVRVERLARIGPDGPEGPRPSDYDPQPPVMAQTGGQDPAPTLTPRSSWMTTPRDSSSSSTKKKHGSRNSPQNGTADLCSDLSSKARHRESSARPSSAVNAPEADQRPAPARYQPSPARPG
jgi:hypothetical protein